MTKSYYLTAFENGSIILLMPKNEETTWDILSENEAVYSASILRELADQNWAKQLIRDISENGGLTRNNKSRLFELRFAYSLFQAGIEPSYEIPGEGNSTLDFGCTFETQEWAIELMRLEETDAVRNATWKSVDINNSALFGMHLSTDADDPRQSPEGETIKAIERICQKCEKDGQPYKFPLPDSAYQVLLVDFRTFLDGSDRHDRIHVGLGGEYVRNEVLRMRWNGNLISGVFNESTTLRGAEYARERVHFIGFVDEKEYRPGAFHGATQFVANPQLFADVPAVLSAMETWPLGQASVL